MPRPTRTPTSRRRPGWGNEELPYYTHDPENVAVRDSCLFIRAAKAPLHGCDCTSARLKTRARVGTVLFATTHVLPEGSLVSDWHTCAEAWEPGEIRCYVDDVQTCTCDHWWSCSTLKDGAGIEAREASDLNPFRTSGRSSPPKWWWTASACTRRSAATGRRSHAAPASCPGRPAMSARAAADAGRCRPQVKP